MMIEPRCLSAFRLGPHRFPEDFVDIGKRFHWAGAGASERWRRSAAHVSPQAVIDARLGVHRFRSPRWARPICSSSQIDFMTRSRLMGGVAGHLLT
jgi:hypothetical protein